jgi:hypothetical protein
MAFWIGPAVTVASVVISFVWPQKTFPIKLILFVLGLCGVVITVNKHFEDQKKAQQSLEYSEVARLNAAGFGLIGDPAHFAPNCERRPL